MADCSANAPPGSNRYNGSLPPPWPEFVLRLRVVKRLASV